MNIPHPPIVRKLTEGRTIAVVGDVYRFLATGKETNGKYALWEAIVPPGGGPPPHVHSREEEGFYVLEGEITLQIGEQRLVATAGMFANMPVGTPHSFKNESGKPRTDADFRRSCRSGGNVLRDRRAGPTGSHDSPATDEGRNREVAADCSPIRNRNPAAEALMRLRWQRTFPGPARRFDRKPPSRANASVVPCAASEARSPSRRQPPGIVPIVLSKRSDP